MIPLLILAGLAPPATALGLVIWRKAVHGDPIAGRMAGSIAIGLVAGVVMGAVVGLGLLLLVNLTLRASGR